MSNFANKVLSVVSGLAVVATAVIPTGVSAALSPLAAANELAGLGIIVDQSSDAAAYRLADTISREELSKVISQLGGLTAVEGDSVYQDTDFASWSEKYAKALNEAGYAASNALFNPKSNTSKVEALKWVMEARDIDSGEGSSWQEARVNGAVDAGIAQSFSDYNTDVTRGEVFVWAAEALNVGEEDDILGDILNGLDDEEDDTPTTPTVSSGELTVSVSPETPVSATIPGGVNGLPVAKFDFTAGSSDVTVSQITIKRRGLSDEETIDSLAVFSTKGRASNDKDDNQENDTEAQLTLTDGGVTIQAGETETLTIVVDIPTLADEPSVESDEFFIELIDVVSTDSDVTLSNLVSNTIRIGSVDAPTLTFEPSSSVSDPTLGEKQADIFEFEIEGDDDEDVVLTSVTFEGSSDAEDDLANFSLVYNNDVIATTASMRDDYLTFTFPDGFVIEEDKTEDFIVKADVIEGATDVITFTIDEPLDVNATSTKFGYGASINIDQVDTTGDLGTITIEAGELTIVEIDADFDEIREDKDNVVLGKFELTNVAGQNLELQEMGIFVDLQAGGAFIDNGNGGGISGDNVQNGTEPLLTVENMFEDFEIYNETTGQSYELTVEGFANVYEEDNIDIVIDEGVTVWAIRADTADEIGNFDNARFELSFTTGEIKSTGGFLVEEQDDDEVVTDITPSQVSFNSIDGSESGVQISAVPLSDVVVVRGADDVEALKFEVEADESSDVSVDEFTVTVTRGAATTAPAADIAVSGNSASTITPDLYELTPVNPVVGDVFSVTLSTGEVIAFTATANTVANVTAGMAANVNASAVANVTATDNGTTVTLSVPSTTTITSAATNGGGLDNQDLTNTGPVAGTSVTTNTNTITVNSATNNATYKVTVNGTSFSFKADDTATVAEVVAGLASAINNTDGESTTATTVVLTDSAAITVTNDNTGTTATGVPATNQEIAQVQLYQGSTLLDSVSGSDIGTNGEAVFDEFADILIKANDTETFSVTIDIVDGIDAVNNSDYNVTLTAADIDDDENDDIDVDLSGVNAIDSTKSITVANFGVVTITNDASNAANEDPKTILAGSTNVVVFSADVQSVNESTDVEEVVFTIAGATAAQLKDAVLNASLYLDGVLIDTNTSGDIAPAGANTIVFDDLTNLIIAEANSELELAITTDLIGFQENGVTLAGLSVSDVQLKEIDGVDSGNDLADGPVTSVATSAQAFSIVSGLVTPTVATSLNASATPELTLSLNNGSNKNDNDNSTPNSTIDTLRFSVLGSTTGLTFNLTNVDDSSDIVAGAVAANVVTFDLTTMTDVNNRTLSSSNTETFRVSIGNTATGNTASLKLLEDGVTYSFATNAGATGLTTNLADELDLGSRTY